MMARKGRFPDGYPTAFGANYKPEGSSSSGRVDMEIAASEGSSALGRKWINLNSASQDGFAIPMQIVRLSKLTPSERKSLVVQLGLELEQIRLLQKKVESCRVDTFMVSSSNDVLSCSSAQKGPPGGSTKKSAVSNPGPGKKSNGSGKGRGWNRSSTGKFESQNRAADNDTDAALLKQCDNLLKKLISHKRSWAFREPVDPVKLNIPDYFTVIKHPMDLGTIKSKLASGEYAGPLDFLADVRLTFSNAMTYNPRGNDFHVMADTMSKFFEARWKAIEKKIPVTNSYPSGEKSNLHEEIDIIDPVAPTKKRKYSPTEHEVVQSKHSPKQHEIVQRKLSPIGHEVMLKPVRQKMTDEEKHNLSRDLEASLRDLPDNIIEFLKEQSSNGGESGEDEIEIDIDDLSDDTLFTLRKLLDEFLQEKNINNAKAETCEMELPNESGLSNSSTQLDKGNDHLDEDVDIGGNEPPASTYPPVEIGNDAKHISNKCSNAESFDANPDSDSSSSSHSGSECHRESSPAKLAKNNDGSAGVFNGKSSAQDLADGDQSVSGLDQLGQSSQKLNSTASESQLDGEGSPTERQVSPGKLYRAAFLKNRFLDTILKAQEKALSQGKKGDPEKLRREREELEMLKRKEKARLQAEAKAAEDARKRAEAEAAAEAKRKRELEREAARQALLKMEKTVEINENSRFLEDLEMLSGAPSEHLPGSVDETSPTHSEDGLGSFKFGASNPLEQLGLYMKADEEEEEAEPTNVPGAVNDVEEGEID